MPTQTGSINAPGQTFAVNFTSNATAGLDFQLDAVAAPATVTFTSVATTVAGAACVIPMGIPQRVICNAFSSSGTLANGSITVTYTGGALAGNVTSFSRMW